MERERERENTIHELIHSHTHMQIDAHQDEANAVAFADDSSHTIASGGDDGICKVNYLF